MLIRFFRLHAAFTSAHARVQGVSNCFFYRLSEEKQKTKGVSLRDLLRRAGTDHAEK